MQGEPISNPAMSPRIAHPTIGTLAAHIGVSRATVNHVLNGRATELRIRPETQQKVLDAARELGYRVNASARAIRSGRFGSIALIQSLLSPYLPGELLNGLTSAVAGKDLHLVLTQVSDPVIDDEMYLPHTINTLSVDGVLINRHIASSPPFMERIHRLRIPAVFLNVKQPFDCVHPDDIGAGRMATEFLLALKHERIVFVDTQETETGHYSKADRRTGYEQAMRTAGKTPRTHFLPPHWQMTRPGDARVESARTLLEGEFPPTAIIAYELAETMAIVHAASIAGLRIPENLSLIHFHHWLDDRFFIPIHTVTNAMEGVGKKAVDMLLEKIERPEVALPVSVVPVRMLTGATCAPPHLLS